MWYLKVSQREYVINAIREYDKLGRAKFLEKYDFSKSKKYFLVYKGQTYDCKPLTYGAYVLQFGEKLKSRDSRGGSKKYKTAFGKSGFHCY